PDVSNASTLVGITSTLYIVVLLLVGGRLYTRLRPAPHLGWDDYMITVAFILAITEWGLLIASIRFGVGRHNYYVPPAAQVTAQKLLLASETLWLPALTFIKVSIACMLLRIKHTRGWVMFLRFMIVFLIAFCIAFGVFMLLICRPLAVVWDPISHPNAVCINPKAVHVFQYFSLAIMLITDLVYTALPATFIWKMHRRLREKIVLYVLMSLGLFAAVTSMVKLPLIKTFGITGDTLWDTVPLSLWAILEQQVGFIAACIPCFKAPFERLL
ncbi:hypothetical protein DM02DRAFT_501956, partial [Periconia macrospinosa]